MWSLKWADDVSFYDQQFRQRASCIPFHGIGLSVDVYSPPLLELVQELHLRGLPFEYLEIFKAPTDALEALRTRIACPFLEYHADGLWVTQPDLWDAYPIHAELKEGMAHLRTLDSYWINQECASKQIAGYSFGTYLPPLLTRMSAEVTASNAQDLQDHLDAAWNTSFRSAPLLLLETPPLTYFVCGEQSYLEFFRLVTARSPCGLVLDIGHLWTVYRYAGYARTQGIGEFLERFVSEFPLDRVVQIHLAGLGEHPDVFMPRNDRWKLPAWIDAHEATIPDVLFDMLDQILAHGKLPFLKGIGLEVDTKPIPQILKDYEKFREKLSGWNSWKEGDSLEFGVEEVPGKPPCKLEGQVGTTMVSRAGLFRAYEDFVEKVIKGSEDWSGHEPSLITSDGNGLQAYRNGYIPHEVMAWGGNVRDMFPMSCAALKQKGVEVSGFLSFWLDRPRPNTDPFNFFLLKVRLFVEFVRSASPDLSVMVEREAGELREAHEMANRLFS